MSAETVLTHPSYSYLAGLLNNVKGELTDMTLAPGVSVHRCLLGKLSPLLTCLPTFMDSSEVLTVVLEGRLNRQFVMHLGQLERETVLSKEEMLRLVIKIQHLK